MIQEHNPVLFNALKHHLGYSRHLVQQTSSLLSPDELRRLLLRIGAAQLDFYTGPLSVDAIVTEVQIGLQEQELLSVDRYTNWIKEHGGYCLVELADSSQWVLRLGHKPSQWVHLHPARYSPHTLRIKAHTLKTALALPILYPGHNEDTLSQLTRINTVRSHLQLSPLAPRQLQNSLLHILKLLIG